jgi:hypothetical protein
MEVKLNQGKEHCPVLPVLCCEVEEKGTLKATEHDEYENVHIGYYWKLIISSLDVISDVVYSLDTVTAVHG